MAEVKQQVAELSVEELQAVIWEMIDSRLNTIAPQSYKIGQATPEWWQSLIDNFIRAEPGIPSPTQLLREERD